MSIAPLCATPRFVRVVSTVRPAGSLCPRGMTGGGRPSVWSGSGQLGSDARPGNTALELTDCVCPSDGRRTSGGRTEDG